MKIYWQIKKKWQVLIQITAKTCITLRRSPLALPTSGPIPRVLGCGLTSYFGELKVPITRTRVQKHNRRIGSKTGAAKMRASIWLRQSKRCYKIFEFFMKLIPRERSTFFFSPILKRQRDSLLTASCWNKKNLLVTYPTSWYQPVLMASIPVIPVKSPQPTRSWWTNAPVNDRMLCTLINEQKVCNRKQLVRYKTHRQSLIGRWGGGGAVIHVQPLPEALSRQRFVVRWRTRWSVGKK